MFIDIFCSLLGFGMRRAKNKLQNKIQLLNANLRPRRQHFTRPSHAALTRHTYTSIYIYIFVSKCLSRKAFAIYLPYFIFYSIYGATKCVGRVASLFMYLYLFLERFAKLLKTVREAFVRALAKTWLTLAEICFGFWEQ